MRWKPLVKNLLLLLIVMPMAYLAAMVAGAVIPGEITADKPGASPDRVVQIYLLSGLLHADIAIPVNTDVLRQFDFLNQSGIQLNREGLRYLVFGWGSEAFYTTAGTYGDITTSATFTAITGDRSVMHVVSFGEIRKNSSVIPVKVTTQGLSRLLSFLRQSFADGDDQKPEWMSGKSHGYGDVFYRGRGGFSIFYPCNAWTGAALRVAGVPLGIWTPTTQSLKWSLDLHN
jgi:uncharacterized protein (TIGR02117 family)